jgi:glycosyltransferase involved in cell wall biosynthesis
MKGRRPKVVLVLNSLRSGGAEKQAFWIAEQLVAAGMEPTIFELCPAEPSGRVAELVASALRAGVRLDRAPIDTGWPARWHRLRRLCQYRRADVLWSWGVRADAFVLAATCTGRGGRWLASVRTSLPRPKRLTWVRTLASLADGIVANSRAGLSTYHLGATRRTRVWLLPNALRRTALEPVKLPLAAPCPLRLVMLGNIKVSIKGYDVACVMMAELRRRGVAAELHVAGRDYEGDEFRRHIESAGVGGSIRHHGEVSRPEEFLRQGHVYVLLSRFEGTPNTLLEALCCGLPAIATDVGDLAGLARRGAPFKVVPSGDAIAAADAVVQLAENWPGAVALGGRGPRWVAEQHGEEHCRAVLLQLMREVIGS